MQLLTSDPDIVAQSLRAINELIDNDSRRINSETASIRDGLADIKNQIGNVLNFIASAGDNAPRPLRKN